MKEFPLPLTIDCSYFGENLIREIRDRLSMHFEEIERFNERGDLLKCIKPRDSIHYAKAWNIIDKFGVKVL